MYNTKNKLVKLLMISALAIIPYTGTEAAAASDDSDQIAVRVRSGAKVKASPVRASVRRDARSDRQDNTQDYSDEQYSEPTDQQQYSQPPQQDQQRGVHDRGRPGGRR